MVNQNNIRVLFSQKADDALSGIITKYGLEKYSAMIKIDYISKAFAAGKSSEKEMPDYLQKELNISQQAAEQISRDIINNIIPFLEKVPEEKFNDSDFREEISKKIFESAEGGTEQPAKKIPLRPGASAEENKKFLKTERETPGVKKPFTPKIPSKIKKSAVLAEEKPKTSGPDKYREPIG